MAEKEMNTLAQYVDDFLYHQKYNKADIARQMNISRQALYNLMRKESFNISDANNILSIIGYKIVFNIEPIIKGENYNG